jgi:hypothetical protein
MSTSTDRQLELTLNALARSVRRTEKTDPTGRGPAWDAVEHRADLLQTMMKTVAEFRNSGNSEGRGDAPSSPSEFRDLASSQADFEGQPAEQEPAPPAITALAETALAELKKARQKQANNIQPQLPRGAHKSASTPPQTQGKGWSLAA